MIPISVKGLEITILPPVIGSMDANITIETQPSENVEINGNGVYSGDLVIWVSGTTLSGLDQVDPAKITIKPSVIKEVEVDGNVVLGVGDNGQTDSPVTFVKGQTSSSSPIQVVITDAGQSEVEGL